MHDIYTYGIRLHKNRRVFTGYSYGEFYDWDLYFENLSCPITESVITTAMEWKCFLTSNWSVGL